MITSNLHKNNAHFSTIISNIDHNFNIEGDSSDLEHFINTIPKSKRGVFKHSISRDIFYGNHFHFALIIGVNCSLSRITKNEGHGVFSHYHTLRIRFIIPEDLSMTTASVSEVWLTVFSIDHCARDIEVVPSV